MLSILEKNPWLRPFEEDLKLRMSLYRKKKAQLTKETGSLVDFANAHRWFGFHRQQDGWIYREWAPAADRLYLTGDFNSWHWTDTPLEKKENGTWEVFLPGDTLHIGSRVLTVVDNGGKLTQHVPLYARRVTQDWVTQSWCCEVWDEEEPFPWTDEGFSSTEPPLIYEAHVGMSSEEHKIAGFREFADRVLPHVKGLGYNTVQLMAVMEHPYYGSFGYQVSSFYAASSRFGYPDDLKYLVNKAHGMGLRVLLDVVHSHAVGNTLEGINLFDGTDYQFFHAGGEGDHPAWGTKLFDYAKNEVIHFLLSNLKFWMEEYHFDGFRFDGVTSMLYRSHGLGESFTDLKSYFSMNTDTDAVTYLQLANELTHKLNPHALTIAEDMSGMPGMCDKIYAGGIGFDYRLGMGIPDLWIKLIKEYKDEDWNLGSIWYELTNRTAKTVAYAESHDQALVGDKTIIFRLADAAMYDQMEKSCHTPVIDRAVALHKMIRLLTMAAGGDGYLTFMGNEFGHPEWIDFPRPGNENSFKYCRRQWSLLYNENLKYSELCHFDHDMIETAKAYRIFSEQYPQRNYIHEDDKVLAFERGGLLFVFNFSPTRSYTDYPIPVSRGVDYEPLFTSDDYCYDGYGRVNRDPVSAFWPGHEGNALRLYLPARTCAVYCPVDLKAKKTRKKR
ncbi:MAG: alpha amylase C-terminal domain-containing protein [Clostridia bacterium]|nr:alpha amylase C-terminal domain-containing protein [Clostridia bacterium]